MTSVQFYIYEGKPAVGSKLVGPSTSTKVSPWQVVGYLALTWHALITTAASGVRGALGVGASKPPPPVVAPA